MKVRLAIVTLALLATILAGCTSASAPEVQSVPSATAEETPTPTPTTAPAAETGTRGNPLPVGQMRKISDESMWTVGAEAPTVVDGDVLRLPLYLQMDWAACEQQVVAQSGDATCADAGVNPYFVLLLEYVTAAGKSYNTLDFVEDFDWDSELSNGGTVYPPLAELHKYWSVSVPAAEQAGGIWKVANSVGDSVYLASGI
ncbi:MAG TPA: hypothetical protein VJU58_10975 [Microbacterium sp.]|nr:hypothetical protein [Microbacterium sp.]